MSASYLCPGASVYESFPCGMSYEQACGIQRGPAADDSAAEAARQAEAERQAEEERERQAEKERKENAAREKEAAFQRSKQEALKSLKGTPGTSDTLKDSAPGVLGLKGVQPRDTEIKVAGPSAKPRDLSGRDAAWKQLHCSLALAEYAMAAIVPVDPSRKMDVDLSEVRYLAGEAENALNGHALGVECPKAPPPPERFTERQVPAMQGLVRKVLSKTVEKAERIEKAESKLAEAERKAEPAKRAKKPEPPPVPSKDDAIAKAAAEQKVVQEKEAEKIRQVYEQQKKNEAEQEEELAEILEAQRVINELNSQKIRDQQDVGRYQEVTEAVKKDPSLAAGLMEKIR